MSKKVSKKVDAVAYIEEKGYPVVGTFAEDKELKKFYKQLPTEVLEDWCAKEELEFNPCLDNEPIHRMRVCMAILYKHFPKAPAKAKSKSKYAEYTTEMLANIALDKDIAVEPTDNMSIMRMRLIMALRANKVLE